MNADSYFEIGHSHKICEDYALAGVEGNLTYAIVSDGCSASDDSDVGARLLSHIARDVLLYFNRRKLLYDFSFLKNSFKTTFEEIILRKCLEVRDTLKFSYDIFDATLLIAAGVGHHSKILFAWGDGYFILNRPSGDIDVISLRYDSGAPYYMSYQLSDDKRAAYAAEFGGDPLTIKTERLETDGSTSCSKFEQIRAMQGSYFTVLEDTDLNQIIVSSDGIGTYEAPKEKPLPGMECARYLDHDVIRTMVAYKNPVGEFVTRRMTRFKNDNQKAGTIHQDDISCAAINFL
jgi:hypothetical protein